MMTPDQVQTVTKVYRKFSETDNKEEAWSSIDECMYFLDWLTDAELVAECELSISKQKEGSPKCAVEHPLTECFVPVVIEAVTAILDLYTETKNLHENNRFVLQYYTSLSQIGAIKF